MDRAKGTVGRFPLTRDAADFEIEVDYSVSGRFRAATHDDPPEGPEVEVFSVRLVDEGSGDTIDEPLALSDAEMERLKTMLVDAEMDRRSEPDPDYDPEA